MSFDDGRGILIRLADIVNSAQHGQPYRIDRIDVSDYVSHEGLPPSAPRGPFYTAQIIIRTNTLGYGAVVIYYFAKSDGQRVIIEAHSDEGRALADSIKRSTLSELGIPDANVVIIGVAPTIRKVSVRGAI